MTDASARDAPRAAGGRRGRARAASRVRATAREARAAGEPARTHRRREPTRRALRSGLRPPGGESGRAAPAQGGQGAAHDHRIGVERPQAVALLACFAAYSALLGVFAHGAEAVWGEWAAGSYGVAALVARWWRRFPAMVPVAALVGAFLVPAAVLPVNWGATSEVRVVERAATLWLSHGSPYIASSRLLSWRAYDPYLPGMSLFGLPHALGFPGPLGDSLVWLAVVTFALLAAACRIVAPGAAGRCPGCRRQALLRAALLVACPVFAFPMALGVTDPPVIALMCLGLAWTARSSRAPGAVPASAAVDGRKGGTDDALQRRGRPLLAGIAIGLDCALKATAWPALPVILVLVAVRDGGRSAARFAGAALASFFAVVVLSAPALLAHPRALWQNLVAYPLGLSRRRTPAASPLPGHLLASTGGLGHLAAIALLAAAALAVGVSLILRPPIDVRQATMRLAIGLSALFLLAPDARFGYFAYPLGILAWLILAGIVPHQRERQPGLQDAACVGIAAAEPGHRA